MIKFKFGPSMLNNPTSPNGSSIVFHCSTHVNHTKKYFLFLPSIQKKNVFGLKRFYLSKCGEFTNLITFPNPTKILNFVNAGFMSTLNFTFLHPLEEGQT